MHLNIWYIILQTRMYNTLQYRHRKSSYYFTMTLVIVPILHLCHGGFILLHIFSLHWRVPFSQSGTFSSTYYFHMLYHHPFNNLQYAFKSSAHPILRLLLTMLLDNFTKEASHPSFQVNHFPHFLTLYYLCLPSCH